eukprot:CAMPEP_0206427638 /NCGR_PEP_ID=MMETSP0324_2-20121206/5162_1 /ASSEMBLY_ACC=CAM_ASM_000836 /TAXON_ID=2866 /ORGANISM="Crypthecodinium cohnii, Strain Seligo" /LENGTH=68 /DNA_ID=CAMNT_0053892961 /DNA_START=29 /DNA_END=235 /DNA_ORIENTATION=-
MVGIFFSWIGNLRPPIPQAVPLSSMKHLASSLRSGGVSLTGPEEAGTLSKMFLSKEKGGKSIQNGGRT